MNLSRKIGFLLTSLSLSSLVVVGCTQERNFSETSPQTQPPSTPVQNRPSTNVPDVPYVPTPENVVNQMLELANVSGDDVLYDLGSGDGRIPITAAQKYGTRGTGVEINPELVQRSRENAEAAGVDDQVEFLQQDLFQTDLSDATVVTLYLLPDVNLELRSKLLRELQPGTRVVSHDFDMGEWQPEQVIRVQSGARQHTIYYWVVPEEIPENLT
ncbi:Methyltransferase type 11 [Stanieria cyanosphaera PCC 7437]|uniref:Methyltransferase type 11 n=1 Tax=Stanieria cyanosphaera (strain ATCC 29371 / PCC 7437) TaxID=111780 RepID=K9XNS7_STAC7|nr:methyltransferase domain-containing protein [Stanieria cyanosphaera]AFZ34265.1 Methyltransferase type 11 [Stanieria cyanosphaera PCC 7437]